MVNWKDIHPDFAEKAYFWNNMTYQWYWEYNGLTYQDAQDWIGAGFKPEGHKEVKAWKDYNLTAEQAKPLLTKGLEPKEYEFAYYLKKNNHQPDVTNLEIVKKQYHQAQHWLDFWYPESKTSQNETCLRKNERYNLNNFHKTRCQITELDINKRNLQGTLNLKGFVNLKILDCSNNQLTALDINDCSNLADLNCRVNPLPGSLDQLVSNLKQLKGINISDTNFNSVDTVKLPRSLEGIYYSSNSALAAQLEPVKWGFCKRCKQPNTSKNRCQSCQDRERQQDLTKLSGEQLINKFIQHQGKGWLGKPKLKWIPYEQFTNIQYLAEGGFSKIYKAQCLEIKKYYAYTNSDYVVLKSLNNSQQITFDFLNEIANTKLVDRDGSIVPCYGLSQDPDTSNYVMVMAYVEGGNLRDHLKHSNQELSFKDKLNKLSSIAFGLNKIHYQNLVHQDLHGGNILNSSNLSYVTDLGLSRPANYKTKPGETFGVLPYVAPEVLQGSKYTKISDIYSFGIIAYELLANASPCPDLKKLYPSLETDEEKEIKFATEVCDGLRPNLREVKIPQEFKDLIKKCWDTEPEKRPTAEELYEIIHAWWAEVTEKKDTKFTRQVKEIEQEYNNFSQNTPYKEHPDAINNSKLINTKEIVRLFKAFDKQASEQELKKIEELIEQSLGELKELVSDFIRLSKERSRGNKKVRVEVGKLQNELKEKGLEEEKIYKIIEYCERFIELEKQQKSSTQESDQTQQSIQAAPLIAKKNKEAEKEEKSEQVKDNSEIESETQRQTTEVSQNSKQMETQKHNSSQSQNQDFQEVTTAQIQQADNRNWLSCCWGKRDK
jgi:serine/threonine protein kinase